MAQQPQRRQSDADSYSPILDDPDFLQRLDTAVMSKRRRSQCPTSIDHDGTNALRAATAPRDDPTKHLPYDAMCHQILDNAWMLFDRLIILGSARASFRVTTTKLPNGPFRAMVIADGRDLPLATPTSICHKPPILMAGPGGRGRYEAVELLLRRTEEKLAEKLVEYPRVRAVPAAGEDLEWVVTLGEGELPEMDDESSSSDSDLPPPPYRRESASLSSSSSSSPGPGDGMDRRGSGAPTPAGRASPGATDALQRNGYVPLSSSARFTNEARRHANSVPAGAAAVDGASAEGSNASDATGGTSEFWLRGRSYWVRYQEGRPVGIVPIGDEEIPPEAGSASTAPQRQWPPSTASSQTPDREGLASSQGDDDDDDDDDDAYRVVRGQEYFIRGRPYQVRYRRRRQPARAAASPQTPTTALTDAARHPADAAEPSHEPVAVRRYRAADRTSDHGYRVHYQQGSHPAMREYYRNGRAARAARAAVRHGREAARELGDDPNLTYVSRGGSAASASGASDGRGYGTFAPGGTIAGASVAGASEPRRQSGTGGAVDAAGGRHDSTVPEQAGSDGKPDGEDGALGAPLEMPALSEPAFDEVAVQQAVRGCQMN